MSTHPGAAARHAHEVAFAAFTVELQSTGAVPANGTPVADAYTAATEALENARAAYRDALSATHHTP